MASAGFLSGSRRGAFLSTAVASIPAVLYLRDSWVGVYRVHGRSMEPALLDGDVVLVRKCDFPPLPSTGKATEHDDEEYRNLHRSEQLHGIPTTGGGSGRHVTAVSGDIVLYQNPLRIRREYLIKRVAGVGGQWLRQEHRSSSPPSSSSVNHPNNNAVMNTRNTDRGTIRYVYDYRLQALDPYTLYVEGDNESVSRLDSRQLGPISKNLLVGVAEAVVWPPLRWQRLHRTPVLDKDGKPRAVWY
jgi:signal peptidase I